MLSELPRRRRTRALQLSLSSQQALYAHDWPGNARQLNHVLRRALALALNAVLDPIDLFPEETPSSEIGLPTVQSLSDYMERSERAYLVATLREMDCAIGEAAQRLGISRKTLWEKMKRYGISRQHVTGHPTMETR